MSHRLTMLFTQYFIEERHAASVKELAVWAGTSESQIRRDLRKCAGGVPEAIDTWKEHRERADGKFTTVWVYAPTREHLRDLVLAARLTVKELMEQRKEN